MMMKIIFVMASLIFCQTGISAEEQKVLIPTHVEPQWPSEHDLCWDKKRDCICKKDLPKFPFTSPKGMKLTSVCGYNSRPKDDFLAGIFYFGGDATVHGKLISERHEGEEGGGDYLLFLGKSSSEYSAFSSSINNLQITTTALSSPKFDYPELSDENNCWSADAVLKIKLLQIILTEQDDAGNFPLKFEIVKVGKFSKCEL